MEIRSIHFTYTCIHIRTVVATIDRAAQSMPKVSVHSYLMTLHLR
jgi:hypothetical protein